MMLQIPDPEPRLRARPGLRRWSAVCVLVLLFTSLTIAQDAKLAPEKRILLETAISKFMEANRVPMGWEEGVVAGMASVGHDGGQQGTSTSIMLVPEQSLGVVVLANMDGMPARLLLTP
jgi:hypothetical protein